jgi:hypothetical protein
VARTPERGCKAHSQNLTPCSAQQRKARSARLQLRAVITAHSPLSAYPQPPLQRPFSPSSKPGRARKETRGRVVSTSPNILGLSRKKPPIIVVTAGTGVISPARLGPSPMRCRDPDATPHPSENRRRPAQSKTAEQPRDITEFTTGGERLPPHRATTTSPQVYPRVVQGFSTRCGKEGLGLVRGAPRARVGLVRGAPRAPLELPMRDGASRGLPSSSPCGTAQAAGSPRAPHAGRRV